jgi:UDPglucose 6-dehydrogenase
MTDIFNVSVIGLGKLGASMAAGMAHRGLNVIGVDVNRGAVAALNEGRAPIQETGLDEMVAANRDRLRATLDYEEALTGSDLSFVIVPTPSDSRGAFSLQYISYAFAALGRALKSKKGYHVFVLTSTVLPGSTRYGLLPILERESGRTCGPDFGLCYNPEFIALGSVLKDFLNPNFHLLGQFDERSGDILECVQHKISQNDAPVRRMSLENAELAKIAINSFITMKVSFANLVAELAARLPGGDVDIVTDALGMDSRIGHKYLTGGLGFGGPCFPRDNVALEFLGRQLGVDCRLLAANDGYNRDLTNRLVEHIERHQPPSATLAVLGLAYKPFSHVIEESPGIALCQRLSDAGYRVVGYDPLAGAAAEAVLKYRTLVAHSLDECLAEADAVLVTTRDPAFTSLTPEQLLAGHEHITLIDYWRCMPLSVREDPRINYVPYGCCLESDAHASVLQDLWAPKSRKISS